MPANDAGTCRDTFRETACKTIRPTLGATRLGRWIGRLAMLGPGSGPLRLGVLFLAVLVPLALAVYLWQVLPAVVRRYRLTTRRIVVEKGLPPKEEASLGLDEFDDIRLEVLPGHEYFHAADLVFLHGQDEVLRLPGVARPEVARRVCLETRAAFQAVREVLRSQPPPAKPASADAPAAAG